MKSSQKKATPKSDKLKSGRGRGLRALRSADAELPSCPPQGRKGQEFVAATSTTRIPLPNAAPLPGVYDTVHYIRDMLIELRSMAAASRQDRLAAALDQAIVTAMTSLDRR